MLQTYMHAGLIRYVHRFMYKMHMCVYVLAYTYLYKHTNKYICTHINVYVHTQTQETLVGFFRVSRELQEHNKRR